MPKPTCLSINIRWWPFDASCSLWSSVCISETKRVTGNNQTSLALMCLATEDTALLLIKTSSHHFAVLLPVSLPVIMTGMWPHVSCTCIKIPTTVAIGSLINGINNQLSANYRGIRSCMLCTSAAMLWPRLDECKPYAKDQPVSSTQINGRGCFCTRLSDRRRSVCAFLVLPISVNVPWWQFQSLRWNRLILLCYFPSRSHEFILDWILVREWSSIVWFKFMLFLEGPNFFPVKLQKKAGPVLTI